MTIQANLGDDLAAIDELLNYHADWYDRTGAARWICGLGDDVPTIDVRYDAPWLRLCMNLDQDDPCRLAERNASAPPGIKYCISTQTRQPALVADIPLDVSRDATARRISDVCLAWVAATMDQSPLHGGCIATSPAVKIVGDLADAAESSAWPVRCRSTGEMLFPLDVHGMAVHAQLFPTDEGAVLRTHPLGVPDIAISSEAVFWLLMQCGFAVRTARPSAGPEGYAWDVAWASTPTPEELRHALSALSVAVRMTESEAGFLANEGIAASYLRSVSNTRPSPLQQTEASEMTLPIQQAPAMAHQITQ